MPKKIVKNLAWSATAVIILGAAAALVYYLMPHNLPTYNFVAAQVQDIKSEVAASGTVKAASDLQLSFERSGKVSTNLVNVGDSVKTGQVLATLDSADMQAQLAQAQAAVLSAQAQFQNAQAAYQVQIAKLQDLKNGASAADLNLSQAQVNSAAQAVADAQTNLTNVQAQTAISLANQYSHSLDLINAAYSNAFDAINTKLVGLFSNQHTATPGLTFTTTNAQSEVTVKNELVANESSLNDWSLELSALNQADRAGTDRALDDSLTRLNNLADFLRQVNTLLSETVTSVSLTPTVLAGYQTSVNAGLANVNASILALNGQKQTIASQIATNNSANSQAQSQLDQAKNSLTVAQKALALKKAGATADQIAAQAAAASQAEAGITAATAAIAQAQANVQNLSAQLAKSVITSPIDGIISQADAKIGEVASPSVPVISIISQAKYQIEVQVPESDIADIKIGQTASVALDAYGSSQNFIARVITIDPASTLINGVPSYKVTLEFTQNYPQIKAGLSANVRILTAENPQAVVIPSSSVLRRAGNKYVIVDNGAAAGSIREVTTGLVSLDGQTEISSGLSAGERVAAFGGPVN